MTGVQTWSVTAANNVNANTGVNWDEGMSPGAVNNSARQVLSDVRTMANDLVWFQYGIGDGPVSHAYASATSTTVAGANVTAAYHAGRRVRAVGASTGTIYGSIASSSYSAPNTTVNYTWDSGSLANESLAISISQVPVTGSPVAVAAVKSALPTRQVLTSGSSATYTTPVGCRQLRIRMVGGGGGGGGTSTVGIIAGGQGGTTTFNSVNAIGGVGADNVGSGGWSSSNGSGTASYRQVGNAGMTGMGNGVGGGLNPISGAGGVSVFGGAPSRAAGAGNGTNAPANSGSGGAGADNNSGTNFQVGGGGQAGEYAELIISSPSATYTYTVGAAGSGGSSTNTGGNGGSGVIIVDEFY